MKGDILMKKIYEAPEVEIISLTAQENVTSDLMDGEMGDASSVF